MGRQTQSASGAQDFPGISTSRSAWMSNSVQLAGVNTVIQGLSCLPSNKSCFLSRKCFSNDYRSSAAELTHLGGGVL